MEIDGFAEILRFVCVLFWCAALSMVVLIGVGVCVYLCRLPDYRMHRRMHVDAWHIHTASTVQDVSNVYLSFLLYTVCHALISVVAAIPAPDVIEGD